MKLTSENVIGIVGGMGPQAGAALFNSITNNTAVSADQQHLSVVLMSFPKWIGDRTAFLEGRTQVNPAFAVANVIKKLDVAGATVVGMACNTCHAPSIYNVIKKELVKMNAETKFLHMPAETCQFVQDCYPQVRRVGVMSTNGTWKAGIYENILRTAGYEVVVPDATFQHEIIHRMIYDPLFGIKAKSQSITLEVRLRWEKALAFFINQGVEAVVLGCTELSLLPWKEFYKGMILIDSTEAFAQALVREALRSDRGEKQSFFLPAALAHSSVK